MLNHTRNEQNTNITLLKLLLLKQASILQPRCQKRHSAPIHIFFSQRPRFQA